MLIVISPAKTLDLQKRYDNLPMTEPRFLEKSKVIMEELSSYAERRNDYRKRLFKDVYIFVAVKLVRT